MMKFVLRLHQQCSNVHLMQKKKSLYAPLTQSRPIRSSSRIKACTTSLRGHMQLLHSYRDKHAVHRCWIELNNKKYSGRRLVKWVSCVRAHSVMKTKIQLEPSVCPRHTIIDPNRFLVVTETPFLVRLTVG